MRQWAIITLFSLMTLSEVFGQGYGRSGNRRPDESPHLGHYSNGQKKRVQIVLNDHFKGRNTIRLKQEIKYRHPGINFRNVELVGVKLVAKSKRGMGEAVLVVGQSESYPQTIGGNPYEFHDNSLQTFDRTRIENPSHRSQGKWQIKLRGNIKVRKVVAILKRKVRANRIQTLTIPMHGQHSRGVHVLKLKRLIKQFNPALQLQNAQIVSVNLIAKSKHGRGQASLVVGQNVSYPVTVPGRPRAFHSVAPRSFTPLYLVNNMGSSQGKWQIELQGNIKVQQIHVEIKLRSRRIERY